MAIRLPLKTVLSYSAQGDFGAGSVAGGVPILVNILQDTDNVVLKLTASTVGGGVSAVFQTTDDGGNTYYDVGRTSIVSNSALPEWLSIPVISNGMGPTSSSVVGKTFVNPSIGNAAASTLGQGQMSGMPLLSQQGRVFLIYTGNLTKNDSLVEVKINSQSATA